MKLIGGKLTEADCIGCSACLNACSFNAITMRERGDTFLYPEINESNCTQCMACEKACPAIKEKQFDRLENPVCYAAWNDKDEIRMDSSSGGVFTSLAKKIIENQGYVYGTAFDEELKLSHEECSSSDDLERLRGSKYFQSKIGLVFSQIKRNLKDGKQVLFVGTPCQVAGLNTFLKKDYENLITCDFVCHGIASAKIFESYIEDIERENQSKVKSFHFRRKKEGWKDFNVDISYESGLRVETPFLQNPFMKGFLADIYLRPSCYQCKYSRLPRVADITLADFWGIWNCMPEIYDKKGVSAVTLNSPKGIELYSQVENLKSIETKLDLIIDGNPSLNSSVTLPRKKRKLFYKLYRSDMAFHAIINTCLPPPTYWDKVKWSFNKRISKYLKYGTKK